MLEDQSTLKAFNPKFHLDHLLRSMVLLKGIVWVIPCVDLDWIFGDIFISIWPISKAPILKNMRDKALDETFVFF